MSAPTKTIFDKRPEIKELDLNETIRLTRNLSHTVHRHHLKGTLLGAIHPGSLTAKDSISPKGLELLPTGKSLFKEVHNKAYNDEFARFICPETKSTNIVTPQSDIFSVGVTAINLITSSTDTLSLEELDASDSDSNISELKHILEKSTNANPNQRFDSLCQLRDQLNQLLPEKLQQDYNANVSPKPKQGLKIEFTPPSTEEVEGMLAGYTVEHLIARGGMAAVYKATQISLDRPVAIKLLPKEFGQDAKFRTAFREEAKLMARLEHPSLIGVHDFGEANNMLYIVMEFAKGGTLEQQVREQPLSQQQALRVCAEIAEGLSEAHEAGVLHRDIKPSNILLGRRLNVKISDFGLARPQGKTETGIKYGTPGYSAPEIVGNPEIVDVQSDIYAVGVILYELITRKPLPKEYVPIGGESASIKPVDSLIMKATHLNSTKRHSSAVDLAIQLRLTEKHAEQQAAQYHITTEDSTPLAPPNASPGPGQSESVEDSSCVIPLKQLEEIAAPTPRAPTTHNTRTRRGSSDITIPQMATIKRFSRLHQQKLYFIAILSLLVIIALKLFACSSKQELQQDQIIKSEDWDLG